MFQLLRPLRHQLLLFMLSTKFHKPNWSPCRRLGLASDTVAASTWCFLSSWEAAMIKQTIFFLWNLELDKTQLVALLTWQHPGLYTRVLEMRSWFLVAMACCLLCWGRLSASDFMVAGVFCASLMSWLNRKQRVDRKLRLGCTAGNPPWPTPSR